MLTSAYILVGSHGKWQFVRQNIVLTASATKDRFAKRNLAVVGYCCNRVLPR